MKTNKSKRVITQMDTIKSVRKSMPPPSKVIKSKKAKRQKWVDDKEILDLSDLC